MVIDIKSEIDGKVWRLDVDLGTTLEEDAQIMTLESMKMEIPVLAPAPGTLKEILVAEGDMVKEGQIVARLQA